MTPVRVIVVGAGSFGRNHLRVYTELSHSASCSVSLVALVESDDETRARAAQQTGLPSFSSVQELLSSGIAVDAASVCVPTLQHSHVAEELLARGIDVLIEKPLSASLHEADRILQFARSHGRVVAVGHLERFNPAVTAAHSLVQRPMFFESHRLSIFTPRSLDVDVVLDLMIHDLDVVLSLAGSTPREIRAVGIPILSSKADIANVRVEFESGCVANFTASRVSTEQVRKLRLFQTRQYLSLDFARQELISIEVDPNLSSHLQASATRLPSVTSNPLEEGAPTAHPTAGLDLKKLALERVEPLRLELQDFLHSVRTRSVPKVDGHAGRAALELALAITAEMSTHAARAGLHQHHT